jgi:uracil phosphoribosyltransferase
MYIASVSVHVVEHPLVHDALVTLRDEKTLPELFRRMAVRISLLLAAEATRDLPASPVTVQTPLGAAEGRRVTADVVVVPVLRAGLGMLDAIRRMPGPASDTSACSATSTAMRESTRSSQAAACLLMIDPMLATGGSAVARWTLTQAGARASG